MLPKTSTCMKTYDGESKWMYFFYQRYYLFIKEKYNHIWNKVTNSIKNDLDYEPT